MALLARYLLLLSCVAFAACATVTSGEKTRDTATASVKQKGAGRGRPPGSRVYLYGCLPCSSTYLAQPMPGVTEKAMLDWVSPKIDPPLAQGDQVVLCGDYQCVTYTRTTNAAWFGDDARKVDPPPAPGESPWVYDCPACKGKPLGFPTPAPPVRERLAAALAERPQMSQPGFKARICNGEQCATYRSIGNDDWTGIDLRRVDGSAVEP